MAGNKTEKPTSKRRKDQRKEGNVFQSKDISTLLQLMVGFYGMQLLLPHFYRVIKLFFQEFIMRSSRIVEFTEDSIKEIEIRFAISCVTTFLPLMLVIIVVSIVASGVQTKWIFNKKTFLPDFKKLSLIKGIKKLFSLKSLVELIKGMIKMSILFVFTYQFIMSSREDVVRTMSMDVMSSSIYMLKSIMKMFNKILLAYLVIAALDYMYQRWEYERNLMMTKQEVKEEYKMMEGDPKVKGKIKSMQRQRAMSRMMQAVPTADVVIKNPTHFAVALKYDLEKNPAPVVVAKGQDELALRIIRIAEENKVYVMENVPLARALYAATEVNREIPPEHYGTIAEILVYIYQLNGKKL